MQIFLTLPLLCQTLNGIHDLNAQQVNEASFKKDNCNNTHTKNILPIEEPLVKFYSARKWESRSSLTVFISI